MTMGHEQAMEMICRAAGVSMLSYEEAIAAYLRARGILGDGAECLSAPIPAGWQPPRPPPTPEQALAQLGTVMGAVRKTFGGGS